MWKSMFIVCLTIFLFNLVSTLAGELRDSACLLCLTIFSSILSPLKLASELHTSACLLYIFSSILSLLQIVSYMQEPMKVHVFCVFDYFLFLISTSDCELCESACLLCVWLFSIQSCLHFRMWVTWKCMFIVCLTIFYSILSLLQSVSYIQVHVYCVWLFSLQSLVVSISAGELCESAWLNISLQSCLHFRGWVTWKCMSILYVCALWLYNGEFSYTIDQFW